MSNELTKVCALDDVDVEDLIQVRLSDGPIVAVYRVDDEEVYVTQDSCTHKKASLGEEGDLDGHIVECTWHSCKFDVRTGETISDLPCEAPLKTYPVTIQAGDVFIEMG